jgi:LPS export ABC transporter protein LptC
VLNETSSGERLYSLEAETAYVYENEQRIEVVMPKVFFYDANARVHATLVADRGMIYSKTSDLVAHGHVNVLTADSTKLWTDSLSWNNRTRLVKTDAPVEIVTPNGRVSGIGLVSDAGLTKIEIQSEVQGTSNYQFGQGIGGDSGRVQAESAR